MALVAKTNDLNEKRIFFYVINVDRFNQLWRLDVYGIHKDNCKNLPEGISWWVTIWRAHWKIFLQWAQQSMRFRSKIIQCFPYQETTLTIKLTDMMNNAIDYRGGSIAQSMVYERLICDTVMSYLSTLGGAFSALGEQFSRCAIEARKISLKQLQIATRLHEEPLIARCRLYLALSWIQHGDLKPAKEEIEEQFQVAKKLGDIRLSNMCRGLWARLQYEYRVRNRRPNGKKGLHVAFQNMSLNG